MWQTESSGPMVGNPYGVEMLSIKPGSATIPLMGIDAEIVDDEGKPVPPGVEGTFVCKRPFPGLTPTLWRNHERYIQDYWNRIPGFYYTGDAAFRDEDGYIWFWEGETRLSKFPLTGLARSRLKACCFSIRLLQRPLLLGDQTR